MRKLDNIEDVNEIKRRGAGKGWEEVMISGFPLKNGSSFEKNYDVEGVHLSTYYPKA